MRHNPGYGIMDQLVEQDGIPILLGAGGVRGKEPLPVGHGDRVGGRGVVGAVALNADGSAGGSDRGLGIRDGAKVSASLPTTRLVGSALPLCKSGAQFAKSVP